MSDANPAAETGLRVAVDERDTVEVNLLTPVAPRDPATFVVLAHGAGGDMHQPLLVAVQRMLTANGIGCARFNFAYAQAGRRAPDRAPRLLAAWRAVLATLRRHIDTRRWIVGGKSMGGRMASMMAAEGTPVDGLLLLGYPLHPAGRPHRLRDGHFDAITSPCLFVQGSADKLCEPALLKVCLPRLAGAATVYWVEQGDHSFKVPARSGASAADVQAGIHAAILDWLGATGRLAGDGPAPEPDAGSSVAPEPRAGADR